MSDDAAERLAEIWRNLEAYLDAHDVDPQPKPAEPQRATP